VHYSNSPKASRLCDKKNSTGAPLRQSRLLATKRAISEDLTSSPHKLPSGQRIRSNDWRRELRVNVKSRERALWESGLFDPACRPKCFQFHDAVGDPKWFAELWDRDARNWRDGLDPGGRAAALQMDLAEFALFSATVRYLNHGVWRKAEDFYQGFLASDLRHQFITDGSGVRIGEGAWISFDEIRDVFGVSRRTFYRRYGEGVPVAQILQAPRQKAAAARIDHGGRGFTVAQFAKAYGLPLRHVRNGVAAGLTGAEIIVAPRRGRGRPPKLPS